MPERVVRAEFDEAVGGIDRRAGAVGVEVAAGERLVVDRRVRPAEGRAPLQAPHRGPVAVEGSECVPAGTDAADEVGRVLGQGEVPLGHPLPAGGERVSQARAPLDLGREQVQCRVVRRGAQQPSERRARRGEVAGAPSRLGGAHAPVVPQVRGEQRPRHGGEYQNTGHPAPKLAESGR